MTKIIAGKTLEQWLESHPLLEKLIHSEQLFWLNPNAGSPETILQNLDIGPKDVQDAADRLDRFAPYISTVFPETVENNGIIESPLVFIEQMQDALSETYNISLPGRLMLKCDNLLPISGSIKARGGIYEVLKHAESLAVKKGRLGLNDNYACLAAPGFKDLFSQYSIAVGSTGNLGLSIGIMGACLGFKVFVHMSADAKSWKKELLRAKGVNVIEYAGDYSKAVAQGRKQAQADPACHFVDDENSKDLFMGYAVAARRLKTQLDAHQVTVDRAHPLFVYLPCGVGGAPGGITFGLKLIFGPDVHCIFAEPTQSPAMLASVYTGLNEKLSVQDLGLNNMTEADGLAVGRPSGFVSMRMKHLIDGFYTVSDKTLYRLLAMMVDSENIFLEPSALAGLNGMIQTVQNAEYIDRIGGEGRLHQATHIAWGTGGSMVPQAEKDNYYSQASA